MEIVELDPIKPMDNIGTSRNSELEQFYQSAITETIGATWTTGTSTVQSLEPEELSDISKTTGTSGPVERG